MNDMTGWLHQQIENQRHRANALKALAVALPAPETTAWLNDIADHLADDADTKQRIIDLHQPGGKYRPLDPRGYCATCGSGEPYEYPTDWPCDTVRLACAGYARQPGYRPEWGPDWATATARRVGGGER